jgi:hypothetical protein
MPEETSVVYRAVVVQRYNDSHHTRTTYMGPYARRNDAKQRLTMAARARWGWLFVSGHVEASPVNWEPSPQAR